jgi:hypothetical protein
MNDTLAIVVWAQSKDSPRKRPAPSKRRTPSPSRGLPPLETLGRALRDAVLVLFGLGLLYHQAVVLRPGEASEVLVGAALMLIFGPVPLRLDERRKNGASDS